MQVEALNNDAQAILKEKIRCLEVLVECFIKDEASEQPADLLGVGKIMTGTKNGFESEIPATIVFGEGLASCHADLVIPLDSQLRLGKRGGSKEADHEHPNCAVVSNHERASEVGVVLHAVSEDLVGDEAQNKSRVVLVFPRVGISIWVEVNEPDAIATANVRQKLSVFDLGGGERSGS
jgi:hypothetical protein